MQWSVRRNEETSEEFIAVDKKGRPWLTVADFHRKNVFLDHRDWAEEPRWKLEDIAPIYLETHQTVRF